MIYMSQSCREDYLTYSEYDSAMQICYRFIKDFKIDKYYLFLIFQRSFCCISWLQNQNIDLSDENSYLSLNNI